MKSLKTKLKETAHEAALLTVAVVVLAVVSYTNYIDKRNKRWH